MERNNKKDGQRNLPCRAPQGGALLRIRMLQVLSVLLAFSGLALLCLGFIRRGIPPPVRAGGLSPEMSFATVRLTDIAAGRAEGRVTVCGVVTRVSVPSPGSNAPYQLMLEEGGAEVPAVFWGDVLQVRDGRLPMPGGWLRMRGEVGHYRGTVQLKVCAPWVLLANGDEK